MIKQAAAMPPTSKPNIVTIVIPCDPAYVSIARLAVLGIANRLDWTTEEVEDIRLAVAEVCTDAVERAKAHDPATVAGLSIEIIAMIEPDCLTIDIRDHIPPLPSQPDLHDLKIPGTNLFTDRQEISDALIEALVDTFARSHELGGTVVRLTKCVTEH